MPPELFYSIPFVSLYPKEYLFPDAFISLHEPINSLTILLIIFITSQNSEPINLYNVNWILRCRNRILYEVKNKYQERDISLTVCEAKFSQKFQLLVLSLSVCSRRPSKIVVLLPFKIARYAPSRIDSIVHNDTC